VVEHKGARAAFQARKPWGFRSFGVAATEALSGNAGSTEQVRYQANKEQNDEDEKTNSGYLGGSKGHNSKTE
jgi:hypothetical protein